MSIVIKNLNKIQKKNFTYQDIDVYQLQGTKGELSISDFDAIRNALNNIFLIRKGSRILHPSFGSNLTMFLFEPMNESTAQMIGESIDNMLRQEPRIIADVITVLPNFNTNSYDINITFIIPSISREQLDANFVFSRDQNNLINSVDINN